MEENNTDQVDEFGKPEKITEFEERYSELERRIVQKPNVVENQGKVNFARKLNQKKWKINARKTLKKRH